MAVLTHPADLRITLPMEAVEQLCRRYGVRRLAVFGSALRGDFGPASDVDFLVEFIGDDAGPWMGKYTDLQEDLARLLGRAVDLVDWRGIEQSQNPIRRKAVLSSARLIYADR